MITIRNLNKTYDRRRRTANRVVRDMSLELPDTGFVCIVGESGCGKTSLLNALGGLDVFDNGQIITENIKVSRYGTRAMEKERNHNFGYIFQNHYLLPEHSVAYNVYLGLHSLKLSHGEKLIRVREALQAVNMERYMRRVVSELSGGQQQRVAIARALARRPRVIFADEPTGNLDEENTLNICSILRQISKTSLVVMVTHEERIARFFADRIITLKGGVIAKDMDSWERGGLVSGGESVLYRDDYIKEETQLDSVRIKVMHGEGVAPAELEIVVLEDRIIIKTADDRMVSASGPEEMPILKDGARPTLTLEAVDNQPEIKMDHQTPYARAGSGLTFGMMLQETLHLIKGKGLRRLSAWIFLVVMTVLTTWIVGDYLTVKAVDPKDFVVTDSHILEIRIERGPKLPMNARGGVIVLVPDFLDYLEQSGLEFEYMPNVAGELRCALKIFPQMESVTDGLPGFSYVPLQSLDESTLVYGRMPERRDEVVIDQWVLEKFLEKDGIIQNTVSEVEELLGAQLSFMKESLNFNIVGICDAGDPALYLTESAYMSVCSAGESVMTYEEFMKVSSVPSYFEGIELKTNECILGIEMAGSAYNYRDMYSLAGMGVFKIVERTYEDIGAKVILSAEALKEIRRSLVERNTSFSIYCEDKDAMKAFLAQGLPEGLDGQMLVEIRDRNGDAWASYEAAATMKADARLIVTMTIVVLAMVMLYLLQRSCVQQRIGMMAVYRLLGIPGRKLVMIFGMESLLLSLSSTVPAAAVTWGMVQVMNRLPSLEFSMVLPWTAVGYVALAIMLYYMIVSLLPMGRLLRLPPAQLAGKYDM